MQNNENTQSPRACAPPHGTNGALGQLKSAATDQSRQRRTVEEINQQHISRIDKFFRMYAGAASKLIAFDAGYIYLEIRVDDRLTIPLDKIARNIAESWRREPELRGAIGYSALISKSARWSGFILEADSAEAEVEYALSRLKEPTNEPDVFLKIIEEAYGVADSPPGSEDVAKKRGGK